MTMVIKPMKNSLKIIGSFYDEKILLKKDTHEVKTVLNH